MHEMGLCENILGIAVDTAKKHGASKIVRVTIKAGEMRGIVDSQMKFCFTFMAKDTIAEEAELVIEKIPIAAKCGKCGDLFTVLDFKFSCPKCLSEDLAILSGKELVIKDIEV